MIAFLCKLFGICRSCKVSDARCSECEASVCDRCLDGDHCVHCLWMWAIK